MWHVLLHAAIVGAKALGESGNKGAKPRRGSLPSAPPRSAESDLGRFGQLMAEGKVALALSRYRLGDLIPAAKRADRRPAYKRVLKAFKLAGARGDATIAKHAKTVEGLDDNVASLDVLHDEYKVTGGKHRWAEIVALDQRIGREIAELHEELRDSIPKPRA